MSRESRSKRNLICRKLAKAAMAIPMECDILAISGRLFSIDRPEARGSVSLFLHLVPAV